MVTSHSASALARMLSSPGYPFDEPAARERIERDRSSGVRDVAAQSRQAVASWHGARLAELRKPALILHGDADPFCGRRQAGDTAAAIPGARLVDPAWRRPRPARRVWPEIAAEVRALADRSAAPAPGRRWARRGGKKEEGGSGPRSTVQTARRMQ